MALNGLVVEQNVSGSRVFSVKIIDGDLYEETTYRNRNGDVWQLPHHPEKIQKSLEAINKSRKAKGLQPITEFRPNMSVKFKLEILTDAEGNEVPEMTGTTFYTDPIEIRLDTPKEGADMKWYPDFRLMLEHIEGVNVEELAKTKRYDIGEITIGRIMENIPVGGSIEKGLWLNFKQVKIDRGYIEGESGGRNVSTQDDFGGGFGDEQPSTTTSPEKVSANEVESFISNDDDDLL